MKVHGLIVWGGAGHWLRLPSCGDPLCYWWRHRILGWARRRPPASITWDGRGIARLDVPKR
jgi:hypothetical protein